MALFRKPKPLGQVARDVFRKGDLRTTQTDAASIGKAFTGLAAVLGGLLNVVSRVEHEKSRVQTEAANAKGPAEQDDDDER